MQSIKTVLGLWKLFIVMFCVLIPHSFIAQDINFEHINTQNGLSQLSVMSIYQDNLGMMWFGTREGINRYDGFNVKAYYPERDKTTIPGNLIYSIVGDKKGNVYFGCDGKLVCFDNKTEKFTTFGLENVTYLCQGLKNHWVATNNEIYQLVPEKRELSLFCKAELKYPIKLFYEISKNQFLIGTKKGLYLLKDKSTIVQVMPNVDVTSIYKDRRNNIWVTSLGSGLLKLNQQYRIIKNYLHSDNKFSISSNEVRAICEDKSGTLWIGTYTGLNRYLEKIDCFQCYSHNIANPGSILHSSVFSIFCDMQGSLWVGTFYGGVNNFNPDINVFNYYYPIPNSPKTLNNAIITKMEEDEQGNIWVGTDGGGVNYLNRKNREFSRINQGENGLNNKNIKVLLYEKKQRKLFVGSHFGGLDIIDIRTGKSESYNMQTADPKQIKDNSVYSLAHDDDRVFFTTQKQVYQYSLKEKSLSEFPENILPSKSIWINPIYVDSRHNLWSYHYTANEVKKTNLISNKTQAYKILDGTNKTTIGITAILEDRYNHIWFASKGAGLFVYKPEKNQFYNLQTGKDGLLSNYCYDLAISKSRDVLILTNKGLSIYQISTNTFKNIRLQDGVPITAINDGNKIFVASDGEIFWGGINGLVSFHEEQIINVRKPFTIHFSELEVNNKKVMPNDKTGILKNSMFFTSQVSFKHTDTNIAIYFATSNYIKINACEYEYKVDGLSDKWMKCNGNRIDFLNLASGNYTLRIRGRYINTNTYTNEISLAIRFNPPFYASTTAILFYFLILSTIFIMWLRFYKKDVNLKSSLEFEKKEKKHIEELNKSKLQFFTNISHEFRTPITLIIGQIESLMNSKESQAVLNKLLSIHKNTSRLNHLLNELLDFRKQEQGFMQLRVKEADIVSFLFEIFNTFNDFALIHHYNYRFECIEKSIPLYFDAVQLQKVFNNLLSNAFKFTKPEGNIVLKIEKKEGDVHIFISDSGIGIPAEELEKVFDSFYQVNHSSFAGSGIGLSLAKGIVELHGGVITATSTKDIGSTFQVILKEGSAHFTSEQIVDTDEQYLTNVSYSASLEADPYFDKMLEELQDADNQKKYRLLIVDDNEEIIYLLKSIFEQFYNIDFALNGKDGIEKAIQIQPDVILSDLMMPIMSGAEMLLKLKSNIETSHIPIILLTANKSDQNMLEGLQYGADDYITKPFNVRHLVIRCNNLVRNRKLLKEKYSQQFTSNLELITHNLIDEEFMKKVLIIIEKNIDKEEFTIDILASEMNIGRNKIYSKIKGITGLTPNDFILNIKLKKAANSLKTEAHKSIAEIAYQFGFGTPQYFSKCFKKNFGLTPLDYRKDGNSSN